ncbi:hypothetical protein [Nocardioides sp.]|uniref:hypothetical protein n=1 Tax=Nocardioides sp. TaxID=35761 RepID=UPI002B5513E0|nr:hypothetical protein [Nocardioides sp.]HXH80589.1 hypothetical protein [Nocardioides sp.]
MNDEISPPAPPPLVTAASLTAVEGLMLVALAVLELSSLSSSRLTMGLTTAAFFAAFGALLIVCAWLVTQGQTWARGPILMAQLIGLGLAWNLRGGQTTLVAVGLAVVAAIVIAGLLHPASVEALNPEGERP